MKHSKVPLVNAIFSPIDLELCEMTEKTDSIVPFNMHE